MCVVFTLYTNNVIWKYKCYIKIAVLHKAIGYINLIVLLSLAICVVHRCFISSPRTREIKQVSPPTALRSTWCRKGMSPRTRKTNTRYVYVHMCFIFFSLLRWKHEGAFRAFPRPIPTYRTSVLAVRFHAYIPSFVIGCVGRLCFFVFHVRNFYSPFFFLFAAKYFLIRLLGTAVKS